MERTVLIISVYVSLLVGLGTTLTVNGSYCCSDPHEEIWADEEKDFCMNVETKINITVELNCSKTALVSNGSDFPVKLNSEGNLVMMLDEVTEWASIPQGEFCLGHQTVNGTSKPSVVLLCVSTEPEVVSSEVLAYCMATSAVFLALTAIVYLALPELRDLQGKSIISLCISLATANTLMCILKVMEYSDMNWCAVRGFLTYFFLISSFFWMNAIAIQILRSIKRSSVCSYGIKEFLWYALYAWGTPALLTLILIIVNYHPGHHEKPGIGHQHCWFLDLKRIWMYMYSVISILMAANVFIFVYTSVYLWKYTFSSNHIRALRYKFAMMLRLFIMMGLPWIFEMVTSLTPTHVIWVIIDISNCLQGIVIFLILVVFRKRVIKALHKHNALCCLTGVAERYLAVGADDEDDMVTHTIAVPLEEKLSI